MAISGYWKKVDSYSLHDAAFLICGLEPTTEEMPLHVDRVYRELKAYTDAQDTFGPAYMRGETHLVENIDKDMLLFFVNRYGMTDFFQEGRESIKTQITDTERATLLKIILSMAINKYGYDPERRNPATGNSPGSIKADMTLITWGKMEDDLEEGNKGCDEKTIRKYLTEAVDLYPNAKPPHT